MRLLALIFLIPALLLQSTVTTIPLVFIVLLCLTVLLKENWVAFLALIFGILLDLMTFRTIGTSSSYFLVFLFLVLLYQRKFEISTIYFVLASSFIGSLGFLMVLGYNSSILFQSIISSLIALIVFISLKKIIGIEGKASKNL